MSGNNQNFHLDNPPIVEAIVDIDCELPPNFALAALEGRAAESLKGTYPKLQKKMMHQFQIRKDGDGPPEHTFKNEALEALLFRSEDEKQLTQFRRTGYSFNRLAPYPEEGMDAFFPEIQRTWEDYCQIAEPIRIRKIGLRMINRIGLPLGVGGSLELDEYLEAGPQMPKLEDRKLSFSGFLNKYQVGDQDSTLRASVVLASQGAADGKLTVLLDIDAFDPQPTESFDWPYVSAVLTSLRGLKNDLFRKTPTSSCLKLFSNPAES
jgi:uncharacterized protein (TIGR04255 family)